MMDLPSMQRMLAIALCLSIAACGGDRPSDAPDAPDAPNTPDTGNADSPAVDTPTVESNAAEDKPAGDESSVEGGEKSREANGEEEDDSTAKGGDPALLIGQWEPIAYVRPDGVEVGLVDLPEVERAELSWEFGDDGSVKTGTSIGTITFQDTTFTATNKDTGEARTFRYTVTDGELFVINPAGDVLKLQRAQ